MARTIETTFSVQNEREMISYWLKGKGKHAVTTTTLSRFKRDEPELWRKEAAGDYEAWKSAAEPANEPANVVEMPAPKKRGKSKG
jgi:hypothetical protein